MHWKENNMWQNTYIFCESFLVSFSAVEPSPLIPAVQCSYIRLIFSKQKLYDFSSQIFQLSATFLLPTSYILFLFLMCKLQTLQFSHSESPLSISDTLTQLLSGCTLSISLHWSLNKNMFMINVKSGLIILLFPNWNNFSYLFHLLQWFLGLFSSYTSLRFRLKLWSPLKLIYVLVDKKPWYILILITLKSQYPN